MLGLSLLSCAKCSAHVPPDSHSPNTTIGVVSNRAWQYFISRCCLFGSQKYLFLKRPFRVFFSSWATLYYVISSVDSFGRHFRSGPAAGSSRLLLLALVKFRGRGPRTSTDPTCLLLYMSTLTLRSGIVLARAHLSSGRAFCLSNLTVCTAHRRFNTQNRTEQVGR